MTVAELSPTHRIVRDIGGTNTLIKKGMLGVVEEYEDEAGEYMLKFFPFPDSQEGYRIHETGEEPTGFIVKKYEIEEL